MSLAGYSKDLYEMSGFRKVARFSIPIQVSLSSILFRKLGSDLGRSLANRKGTAEGLQVSGWTDGMMCLQWWLWNG
jgi:hypothetical protein